MGGEGRASSTTLYKLGEGGFARAVVLHVSLAMKINHVNICIWATESHWLVGTDVVVRRANSKNMPL